MNSPYNNAPPPITQSTCPTFGKVRGRKPKRKQQDNQVGSTNKRSKLEVPYSQVNLDTLFTRPQGW